MKAFSYRIAAGTVNGEMGGLLSSFSSVERQQVIDSVAPILEIRKILKSRGIIDASFELDMPAMSALELEAIDDWQLMNKKIDDDLRIGALTQSPLNMLMWSHYAGDHKGFCVQYELEPDVAEMLFPVYYTDTLFDMTRSLAQDDCRGYLMLACLHKAKEWSYEEEWRFICPSSSKENFPAVPARPTGVLAGCNASSDLMEKLFAACTELCIPLGQVEKSKQKFELLENWDLATDA